ncbi:MAG: hypothetical protein J6T18_04795 [Bacteroidaceae bacterium]|nr:hypothetical protein [Bacteroidaceae bacterium]
MKKKEQLRYPTTAEIVEFVFNRDRLRVNCISLSYRIAQTIRPGYRGPDVDDDTWWVATCELKEAFLKRENLITIQPEDLPELIRKEVGIHDDESYKHNVVDLVEHHWYHHKEVYDINESLPSGGNHCLTSMMEKETNELEQREKDLTRLLEKLEANPETNMDYIHDHDIQALEKEIIRSHKDSLHDYSRCAYLLSLRKELINQRVLEHQEDILREMAYFDDTMNDALRELSDRAYRIWSMIKDNRLFGGSLCITARCYLEDRYPEQHPIQGDDRRDLWDALTDTGLNRLYKDGVTLTPLTIPDSEDSITGFTGSDSVPHDWSGGLDPELTKHLHLTTAFRNLFKHTYFAITDLIYVHKFRTEFRIDIKPNQGGRGYIFEKARLNKYDGQESMFPSDKYKIWVETEDSLVFPPNILIASLQEGWHIKVEVTYVRLMRVIDFGIRERTDKFDDVVTKVKEWLTQPTTMPGRIGSNKDAATCEWDAINEE